MTHDLVCINKDGYCVPFRRTDIQPAKPLRLAELLQSEIARGVVSVSEDERQSVVTFTGDNMFMPGQAVVNNNIKPTLDKVASEINRVMCTVYSATKSFVGPKSLPYVLPKDPYDNMFILIDKETGNPVPDFAYKVKTADGAVYQGLTNELGEALRIGTSHQRKVLKIERGGE